MGANQSMVVDLWVEDFELELPPVRKLVHLFVAALSY